MKKRVAVFCGGSGARELIKALTPRKDVEVTILVNCYDDGLSTGQLRRCIPGMLGPSDIRKTVRHSIPPESPMYSAFTAILDFRFKGDPGGGGMNALMAAAMSENGALGRLDGQSLAAFTGAIDRFLSYCMMQRRKIFWDDMSLGNVFFAGLYLESLDFNKAVKAFSGFFGVKNSIFNLTDGNDLRLVGTTDDQCFLPNEASISMLPESKRIQEIFLIDAKLAENDVRLFENLGGAEKNECLKNRSRVPDLNPDAYNSILAADIIIYWAGTQHSSLLPSYLTNGVAEAVGKSKANKKILVINILKDRDIGRETAFSLMQKFFWYMSRKGEKTDETGSLVTDVLINNPRCESEDSFLPLGIPYHSFSGPPMAINRWCNSHGKHDISKLLAWLGVID
jgi:2-phospho-L-lactate transferase/gluconeogenesis factor (CofD/UPF0052 family)